VASLSTHVLDTGAGAAFVGVRVEVHDESGRLVGEGHTDRDGRVGSLARDLIPGDYTLRFEVAGAFVRALQVTVALTDDRHYHVPLLTSGWSAVTYLGT
jgi:5-hydroxyisourate hydrolase